jgi:phospholipid/cholesterol/gamma-HCH transport system substrate-binding protein
MSSQALKLKIGLFVVTSLLLAVGIIIWLGASRFFEQSSLAVAYFTESVQGLEADSPVKYRGVPVGRVKAIQLAPDGRLIEVLMALHRNFKITEDLGVKMNLLGLTGLKYVEINTFRPDQPIEPIVLDFKPRYPVIPTYPSDIREIGNALDFLFQKIKGVDVERISNNVMRVSAKLDKILSDPKLDNMGTDMADALREIKEASRRLNDEIARWQPAKSLNKTLEKASELLQEGTETTRSADRLIRRTDNNLNNLTQKLDRSADNLIEFTRKIKLNPSTLISIFGREEKTPANR